MMIRIFITFFVYILLPNAAYAKCPFSSVLIHNQLYGTSEKFGNINKKIILPYSEDSLVYSLNIAKYKDGIEVGFFDYIIFMKLFEKSGGDQELLSASIHSPYKGRIRSFRCGNASHLERRRRR